MDSPAMNGRMNNELQRFRKKAVVANLQPNPAFAWKGLGKPRTTSVKIADVPAEIRTEHLHNKSPYRYHCTNLV
jgi:hypothetical protein